MLFVRLLSSLSGQDVIDTQSDLNTLLYGLNWAIPEQIFSVIDFLTNLVGYIMPLHLYSPIITLILSYWLILIVKSALSGLLGFISKITWFFR